ncbi:MAG: hypothetical protein IMX06_02975 [Kyrpidia tusciae]|nr:GAF domain-containing protein [Kyrpidia tusciae]MBE3551811.1 hypothetical protein [Kyrpidia tusciae]
MAEDPVSGGEVSIPALIAEVDRLLDESGAFLPGLCNVTSYLFHALSDLSWLGWYVTESVGGDLTLGPFQGPPTVPRIGWGKGVVGSAAFERAVQIVADVRRFPGNLRDRLGTRSEVALPVIRSGIVQGVLSVKSQQVDRFSVIEVELFSAATKRVGDRWPKQGLCSQAAPKDGSNDERKV